MKLIVVVVFVIVAIEMKFLNATNNLKTVVNLNDLQNVPTLLNLVGSRLNGNEGTVSNYNTFF